MHSYVPNSNMRQRNQETKFKKGLTTIVTIWQKQFNVREVVGPPGILSRFKTNLYNLWCGIATILEYQTTQAPILSET